jgi:transposase
MTEGTTAVATIGCDLGEKMSTLCVLWPDGKKERPSPVKTTREEMRAFFTRPKAHVVMEVGTHSRWVSALLKELGHQVTVANARRVKLISENDSKSDKTDAELLARLGRADVELLAPIQHRGMEAQADLAVAKARDGLVGCRTKLVNMCRGLVKSFGERLPSCSSESFHVKAKENVPKELKRALEPVFQALEKIHEAIRKEDKTIERLAKKYPDVEVLAQPNGVGVLTAIVFLLTLEDKNRFKSSRTVGAFVGLRPRKSQSGEDDPQLRITKAGDPFLRKLLVQCANYELHDWSIRERQRPETMGIGTDKARGEERTQTSTGGSCEKDSGVDAPALGNRRGLRAPGLQREASGRVTSTAGHRGRTQISEVQSRSSAPERETTNRPVWMTAHLSLSAKARRQDGSVLTVRTPMCTGPQMRPIKSADGSMAERILERSLIGGSAPIDTERPPHGRKDRLGFGQS